MSWCQVLDALCKRFGALLKSRQAAELPNAQNIANTIWALSELKFAPADELAMSMRLGLRPLPEEPYVFGDTKLCAALNQLQLPFKAKVCIQNYWADAVLESESIEAQAIILRLRNPSYIRNIPGRLTGRAAFSAHLLAKQGRLVELPRQMTRDTMTVERLADYLKPILTAAAGGSLDAYRS
ncbi:hypothetical protein WJX82_006678 [Trebouxia sp. C0006]